jgi:uncharacterized CHY-type Zn-finger protein
MLMSAKWHKHTLKSKSSSAEDPDKACAGVTDVDKSVTYHVEERNLLGCPHYHRNCKLFANCCNKWYTCRLCHDENENHKLDRTKTEKMMCMFCSTVSSPSKSCHNCHKEMGHYFCDVCKFWDNDKLKKIYHCNGCGICRLGEGLGIDYFHCKTCDACLSITLKDNHRCIERNLDSDCPICGEYMRTSPNVVIFLPCGHAMHHKCHQEYLVSSYQCPICWKSIGDMTTYFAGLDAALAQHQMPPEYKSIESDILCNDCEKRSFTKFHFLYHKCIHCSSYNTRVISTRDTSSE